MKKAKKDLRFRAIDSNKSDVLIYCFVIFCLFMFLIPICRYTLPSFDGAMNLQVPKNLIENGKYAADYPVFTLFDIKIQTGAPVLIPIAFLMLLFGKTFNVVLVINALYIVLLVAAVAIIMMRKNYATIWFLFSFLMLIITPYFWVYGFGIYGEICGLALVFMGLLFLTPKTKTGDNDNVFNDRFFISGIFFGLAVLTKTVLMICVGGCTFVLLVNLCTRKIKIRQVVFFALGFFAPILLFEIYKVTQMGTDAYLQFCREQITSIMQQAGVKEGFSDTDNRLTKLVTHFQLFRSYFNV